MIDNIIFDFGGVVLDINPQLTIEALKDLGFQDWEKLNTPEFYQKIILPLEKGLDTPEIFRDKMRGFLQINLSDHEIDTAWNALLYPLAEDRINLIKSVNKHYNTFLLSNSNFIHYQFFLNDLNARFGYKSFNQLFNQAYFSFELQLIKPNKNIYDFVIQEQQLNPLRTLFIDDRIDNIQGAKSANLKTLHLQDGNTLFDIFYDSGLLKEVV